MVIKDIFYKSVKKNNENQIIKSVNIDWNTHANGILNIAKILEPDFVVTDKNKHILRLLLLYFTGNDSFIDDFRLIYGANGSLNKGLMIVGGVGTGKSLLFRIFKEYTREIIGVNSFNSFNCIDIIDQVNILGSKHLEQFSNNFDNNTARPKTCYFDDIASKNETVKHYGTEMNVIEQLLSLRYNVFERYGKLTHCTSNKYPSELKNIYDVRIVDRLKEMFNIIELNGESFRK